MAKIKIEIKYSLKVTKNFNKVKARDEIINSTESSPALRKEMARVFQIANRRIQNIEKTGEFSPAVAALGLTGTEGYSKFRIGKFNPSVGGTWADAKREYSKVISFLNSPTSTATGTREFNQQVKKQLNVPDDLYGAIADKLLGDYNAVSSQMLNAIPYTDLVQEYYDRAYLSASSQMERDAKEIADNLQKAIDEDAKQQVEAIDKTIDTIVDAMKDAFSM